SCWKVLGGCRRRSVQQLEPIEEPIKASTTSQATSPRIASTSQDTVHWITCRALKRLRRGSAQQPSKVTQCSRSKPKSLAYSSVKIRWGLLLLHVSILPSCFQSFQNSSICQRKRMSATTCSANRTPSSTLVNTSSHSNCRCLLTLTLWRLRARLRGWRPGPRLGRRPHSWTPLLLGR